jgi:hypothetical protein
LKFRPANLEEFERAQPEANKKLAKFPWVRLAFGQMQDIHSSRYSGPSKLLLTLILLFNFVIVIATKILYRSIWKILGERTPPVFTRFCARIVYPDDDIRYIIPRDEDSEYYPKEWPLRKIRQSKLIASSSKRDSNYE